MKNSNDTSWDRTSDLPICSTEPCPLCHRGPKPKLYPGRDKEANGLWQCLLTFGVGSFVSHIQEGTCSEGVRECDVEKIIWAYERGCNRRLGEIEY